MAKDKAYSRRVDTGAATGSEKSFSTPASSADLIFGRKNYYFILGGLGLMFLGFALMSGGHMPSPEVWDESLIYSFRRITLAPILILAGLVVNVYAIFVKK